ncbi:MAG: magnesium transporter CorA [Actinobacteria bacterium 13_2_20CM_2_71_6]|nr:MAG: magnesium transporter CorA [Actinobacteria bacterium 13_2_20CM_2_71_6]
MADPRDHRGLSRALNVVTRMLGTGHDTGPSSTRPRSGRSAIVDCGLYVGGKREPGEWHYDDALAAARRRPQAFVWVGLHEPGLDELAEIAATFELHELPVEDAIGAFQRPKIERYGDMTFAVVRTTRYVEHTELTESSEVVETGSVSLFIGDHYVITVRHGTAGELAPVRAMLEDRPELLAHGPWSVAHAVYDRIVDSYLDCAAAVELDLDMLEESVFGRGGARGGIQRIYQLKRELVEFRRAVVPLQRPLAAIVAGRLPEVPKEIRRYFRDVTDHLTRTVEQVQSFDELLNSILQARLAQVTVEQNDDMRKIAAWAGIAAVWTSIAGIYGMNFDRMPELHWKYGYAGVWAFCVLASIVLYRLFRKNGWL